MKAIMILLMCAMMCGCMGQGEVQGQGQTQSQSQSQGASSSTSNSGPTYDCSNGAVCGNNNTVGGNVGNGNTGGNSGSNNTTGSGNSGSSNGGVAYYTDTGVCVPGTCAGYGVSCGLSADGCDGVMNCGTCPDDAGPSSTPPSTGGGTWSSCFDPTDAYPTGVLMYPTCTAYCQSTGKTTSSNCQGPDPSTNATWAYDNVLVWCNTTADTCGNLSQYPDYIFQCVTSSHGLEPPCVMGNVWNGGGTASEWSSILTCEGSFTSIQCCCE
jgi:hypothetical protein